MTDPLRLPWPAKELSPNARCHWHVLAEAKKLARQIAYFTAYQAEIPVFPDGDIVLDVTLCPPDRRVRDRDNIQASLKATWDGIAQAWGVNDRRFKINAEWGAPVKGGDVVVVIGGAHD
jgi:crossover junction endodeoxyribonuclease RusA